MTKTQNPTIVVPVGENNPLPLLIDEGISRYRLIEDGDRIVAAISGGKDSLTMLHFLRELQKREGAPRFELLAVHIKTDFHCASCVHRQVLTEIFNQLGVKSVIKEISVLDEKKTTNCFWCSWNRRKCLFETAQEQGFNKVAFGHHKDDIAETILLNLFYKGEIAGMKPLQELFEGKITIIRPLCLVEEDMIRAFACKEGFPHQLCRCPFGATSKRKTMKELLKRMSESCPDVDIKGNLFSGLSGFGELSESGGGGRVFRNSKP